MQSVDQLEQMWELDAVERISDPASHIWGMPAEIDGMRCRRCGLVVSVTEYPQVRDGRCEDWVD